MNLHARLFVGLLGLLAVEFFTACGSSKPPIIVTVTAPRSQTDQGLTIPITAQITNDSSGQGLKWSLTGVGSLSATSGGSVTYTAPAVSNITTVQSATVTATSVADPTKSASLAIIVNPWPIFANLFSLASGSAGVPYSQSVGLSGGTPPFQWVEGDGALPVGLTLNPSTGTISGTPTQGGTWNFILQVTDAVGAYFNSAYSLEVQQQITGNNPVPFLTQPLVPSSTAPGGGAFTLTVNGTGFSTTATVNFDGTALPTTFVSQGQLQASVPAATIASAATHSVTVVNPTPGGGSSNVIYFPVATPETTPSFAVGPAIPISSLLGTLSVSSADFNQDGKPDLAISSQANVAILLGNGDGTFTVASGSPFQNAAPPMESAIFPVVYSLVAADFFHSGHPGLAVVGSGDAGIWVFNGNGDGTMTPSSTTVFTFGLYNGPTTVADFNGDGYLDLLTTNYSIPVELLLGYGNGAFNEVPSSPFGAPGATDIAVGDFNGDGKLDFAICLGEGLTAPFGGVQIYLGNGSGSFTQVPGTLSLGILNAGLVVADFNGDGKLDLAYADADDNHSSIEVLLGQGDGTFVPAEGSPIQMPGVSPNSIVVGDFLNHSKLDLIVSGDKVVLLPGNGDGTFQSGISLQTPSPWAPQVPWLEQAVADFNGSGRLGYATIAGPQNAPIQIVVQQ